MIDLKTSTFDETVQQSEKPVVVDFWAEWCGPCRMFAPIMEEVAEEYGDQLTFCKLNTDESPEIAERFEVMTIPTLILFKDGKAVSVMDGVRQKEAVEAFLGV